MCYKAENVDLSFIFFLLFLNWYLLYAFPRSYDRSHPIADLIKCSNFLVFSKTIHRLWSRSNSGGVLSIIFFIYAFIYSLFVVVVMEYWTLARALHHQWPSHHTTYSSPLCSTSKHWRLVVRWESSYIGYIFLLAVSSLWDSCGISQTSYWSQALSQGFASYCTNYSVFL